MDKPYMTVPYKGYEIQILPDNDCESPNDWNNDLFLVGFHRQFSVEKKGFEQNVVEALLSPTTENQDGVSEEEVKNIRQEYHVFPLEAYIHSGVVLSLHSGVKKDRWDSSVLGAVFIKRAYYKTKKQAQLAALDLLETWNDYLAGNVYGYNVEAISASCYGFYGDPKQSGCIEEVKAEIDAYLESHPTKTTSFSVSITSREDAKAQLTQLLEEKTNANIITGFSLLTQ